MHKLVFVRFSLSVQTCVLLHLITSGRFLCLKRYHYFLPGFQQNGIDKNTAVFGRKGNSLIIEQDSDRGLFFAEPCLGQRKISVKYVQGSGIFCDFHGAEAAV